MDDIQCNFSSLSLQWHTKTRLKQEFRVHFFGWNSVEWKEEELFPISMEFQLTAGFTVVWCSGFNKWHTRNTFSWIIAANLCVLGINSASIVECEKLNRHGGKEKTLFVSSLWFLNAALLSSGWQNVLSCYTLLESWHRKLTKHVHPGTLIRITE